METKRHAAEMARLCVKEAELAIADCFDIAVAVKDAESVAIFQDAGAVIREGRRGEDVVLIFDANDIGQLLLLVRVRESLLWRVISGGLGVLLRIRPIPAR